MLRRDSIYPSLEYKNFYIMVFYDFSKDPNGPIELHVVSKNYEKIDEVYYSSIKDLKKELENSDKYSFKSKSITIPSEDIKKLLDVLLEK
jgi:hypothetical protein